MNIKRVNTRFMEGNKTDEVFDLLADHYGMREVCNGNIDWCEAIFSNGFILAIKNGMIPVLGSEKESVGPRYGENEFHHFIYEDICYKIDFKEL